MKLNGLILFITACILSTVLSVPLLVVGAILACSFNDYLLRCAISIDILGNVVGGPLFNKVLQKGGHRFGNTTQTISYAIAMNKYLGKLTKTGIILGEILDFIDPGHTDIIIQRAIRIKHIN